METHEGPVTQSIQAGAHHWRADEPAPVGRDSGPDPYRMLLAALGACTSMTVRLYAARKGWPLHHVEVRLALGRVHAEDCADCESETGVVTVIVCDVTLDGPLDEEQRSRLLDIARRCPVHRTLSGEIKIVTGLIGKGATPSGGEE
ncbi:MAG: OsmC family protein [Magnetospirillum sp.]|nr:OsmC family protein [Magnetospirillum sp.]